MKSFLLRNGHKMIWSTAALVFSIGFFIQSVNQATAEKSPLIRNAPAGSSYRYHWVESNGYAYQLEVRNKVRVTAKVQLEVGAKADSEKEDE